MADDIRALKRRHLIYYLEVYNDETNDLMGHLVDITTEGLKLVSKEKIPEKQTFKLRMSLPEGYFEQKVLRFEATSRWSFNDVNPDFYDTGFSVPNLVPKAKDIIIDLVNQLSFNE
ncbi:MAG: PilZ domain-containing protein [Desulfobulbaceae bacterium]|nr:PilZ domain-containing protein [Desulfobulbaceae bacterium]